MEIRKVGVLGCGLMGSGIAEVARAGGLRNRRARGGAGVSRQGAGRHRQGSLGKAVEKGKLAGATSATPARPAVRHHEPRRPRRLRHGHRSDHRERWSRRRRPTPRSTRSCKKEAIFACNTSSLTITELAMATAPAGAVRRPALLQSRAGDEAGRGGADHCSPPTRRSTARSPSPSRSARSRSPRATTPASSSTACSSRTSSTPSARSRRAWARSRTSTRAMQLGCGYPMGPFTLLDFVGLDTTYYIANIMFEEYREKRFAAAAAAQADGPRRPPRARRAGGASTSTASRSSGMVRALHTVLSGRGPSGRSLRGRPRLVDSTTPGGRRAAPFPIFKRAGKTNPEIWRKSRFPKRGSIPCSAPTTRTSGASSAPSTSPSPRAATTCNIAGEPERVQSVERLLQGLTAVSEKGYRFRPGDVQTAIRVAHESPDSSLVEFFLPEGMLASVRRLVAPRTFRQQLYLQAMIDYDIVISVGPAGTGKTYLAVAMARRRCWRRRSSGSSWPGRRSRRGRSSASSPAIWRRRSIPYLRPLHDALHDIIGYEKVGRMLSATSSRSRRSPSCVAVP